MELLEKHFAVAFDSPNGIKELRSLILKLAMMGKLVPQDPNDQPASELLKAIQAEKEKLIAEGKFKRQKDLPEIKPEEMPYELPNGWEWCRFEKIVDIGSGITKGRKLSGKELTLIPYLRVANVQRGYLDLEVLKEIQIPKVEEKKYLLVDGDLLITEGGDWDKVGRTCIWRNQIKRCGHQNHVFRARKIIKNQNEIWLERYLNSPFSMQYFAAASKQTTNLASINKTQLRNCPVPIPPLNEQKRIVTKINELMTRCDEMERLKREQDEKRRKTNTAALYQLLESPDTETFQNSFNFITRNFSHLYSVKENVEALKKSILQLAMMGKLVPQDPNDQPASELLKAIQDEKEKLIAEGKIKRQKPLPEIKPEEVPYELPAGWVWCRLGEVGNIFNGNSINATKKNMLYSGIDGIPYIATKDVGYGTDEINYKNGVYIPKDEPNFKVAHKNSVLICSEGGSAGKKCGITKIDICFGNKLYAIELFNEIPSEFILYYYLTSFFFIRFKENMTGIIGGVSIVKFNNIILPLPPLNEQKRIVSKINELMSLCDSMIERIDGAEETREKLLQSVLAQV